MKKRNPNDVEKELRNITDGLGMPMDEEMIRPCVILNSLGYKTRQSCQGHEEKYGSSPWIQIIWDEEISKEYYDRSLDEFFNTLFKDLEEFYKNKKTKHINIISITIIQSKSLIIKLAQDTDLKIYGENNSIKMKEYLKEIQDFCEFLNRKYNLNY